MGLDTEVIIVRNKQLATTQLLLQLQHLIIEHIIITTTIEHNKEDINQNHILDVEMKETHLLVALLVLLKLFLQPQQMFILLQI